MPQPNFPLRGQNTQLPPPPHSARICTCPPEAIVTCACDHRPRHAQRASLVLQAAHADWSWQEIEASIKKWHHNLARLGLSKRVTFGNGSELRRCIDDAWALYSQAKTDIYTTKRTDQLYPQRLALADCENIIALAARARVPRRYHFANATFRLLQLHKAHQRTPWVHDANRMAISRTLLRDVFKINWRTSTRYLKEWKRLRLVSLARKANRQKKLCRLFNIHFTFTTRYAGDPPRLVPGYAEFNTLDECITHALTHKLTTLRQLISHLGNSRQLRRLSQQLETPQLPQITGKYPQHNDMPQFEGACSNGASTEYTPCSNGAKNNYFTIQGGARPGRALLPLCLGP